MSYQAFNNFKTVDDQSGQDNSGNNFTAKDTSASQDPSNKSGGQGQGSTTAQSTPTSSGRFTNLQNYLSANKNFNQGQGLGGKLTQGINDQATQFQKNLNEGKQAFNDQASQGAGGYYQPQSSAGSPPPGSSQYITPDTTYKTSDYVKSTIADPTKATDQDVSNFQNNYVNATYGGPQDLTQVQGKDNYGYLQGQAQNLQQNVQNAQTESGRFDLLKQMFNRPTYSTGQQSLDNLLIQSSPQQMQQLQGAQKTAQQANLGLQQAEQGSTTLANQFQTLANNTRTGVAGDLGNAVNNIGNTVIPGELSAAQQQIKNAYDPKAQGSFANNLSQDNISADLASQLGLTNGARLYGINLSNPGYYMQDQTTALNQLTPQMAASQQDYAQLAALGKLAGNANLGNAQGILSQYTNPALSGTFNTLLPQLNTTTIKNDLAARNAAYNAATDISSSDPTNAYRQIDESQKALTSPFAHGDDYYLQRAPGYAQGGILGAMKTFADALRAANPSQFKGADADIINLANSINAQTNTLQAQTDYGKGKQMIDAYSQELSKLQGASKAAQAIQDQYSGQVGVGQSGNVGYNSGVNETILNQALHAGNPSGYTNPAQYNGGAGGLLKNPGNSPKIELPPSKPLGPKIFGPR